MEKIHLERVGSTMTAGHSWIDALYEKGDDHTAKDSKGAIIYADIQDCGRGSKGRSWESSTLGNAYVTYVIPQNTIALNKFTLVPAIVALSVHRTLSPYLRGTQHQLQIKWPNDVLDESGRKISGSIVETYREFILIGTGINIVGVVKTSPSFAGEGGRVPCSLRELIAEGAELPGVEEVVERMYEEGLKVYLGMIGCSVEEAMKERNCEKILTEWSEYVNWTVPVVLREDPSHTEWIPLRITKEGFLVVRHPQTQEEKTLIDSYIV